jgi:Uma2 family endonuclease
MSAAEFLALPEAAPGERAELVQGEVIVSPRPSLAHQYASAMLSYLIVGHLEQHQLGMLLPEVDAKLGMEDVHVPDLLYFRAGRLPSKTARYADQVPDLCIEIVSPAYVRIDRVQKFQLYQARGVAHYWMIHPEEHTIEAYALENGRYVSVGEAAEGAIVAFPPFPDLRIPLAKLWMP